MRKNNQILFITNFSSINTTYITHELLINHLAKKFNKLVLINAEKLILKEKKKYFFSDKVLKRSKKILFKNINFERFCKLTQNKNNIAILNLNLDPNNFKIYKYLNKNNFKLIMISNIGNFQKFALTDSHKSFLKTLNYIYKKYLFPKILTIASNIGMVKKIDIKFSSNRNNLKNIEKNIFKNFLYKNNFLLTKKIIIVNSKVSDLNVIDKSKKSQKYIIHLDQDLTYKHVQEITKFKSDDIDLHYKYLNIFLKRISKIFNKEIIISIHPNYDQKLISKKLKNYKVVKYKTRELIKQSYLVTFFESSSIVDAIIMKKKILALKSSVIGNESIYSKKLKIPFVN